MLRVLSHLRTVALYPLARFIVTAQSQFARLKTLGKRPVIVSEAPYDGQKIMLLALYQKGKVRPDVVRLLRAAKSAGLYILAVNTLKLNDITALNGFVDCYIERPNFGRDFGSYKTGFLHLFKRGWAEKCGRLLMINDSVYFSEERLPKFLDDMMSSEIEVLGSTENFEFQHHLGSFCIAMAGTILRNQRFRTYWRKYRLSDVRPRVIERGEMKLSTTLKRCVSSSDQFVALYDAPRYLACLNKDNDFLEFSIRNARHGKAALWKSATCKNLIDAIEAGLLLSVNRQQNQVAQVDATITELNSQDVAIGYDDLVRFVNRHVESGTAVPLTDIDAGIMASMVDAFISGSQIHQNTVILLRMGLPIVKLDGMYRGAFNMLDVQNIMKMLTPHEAQEIMQLLIARPFGMETLFGWQRAAFMRGLI